MVAVGWAFAVADHCPDALFACDGAFTLRLVTLVAQWHAQIAGDAPPHSATLGRLHQITIWLQEERGLDHATSLLPEELAAACREAFLARQRSWRERRPSSDLQAQVTHAPATRCSCDCRDV